MSKQKVPLENYIVAAWLAQQCQVSRGMVHSYAIQQRLRYYLFSGVRYLERNDAIKLVKQLSIQQTNLNLPRIVRAIERYHSRTKVRSA